VLVPGIRLRVANWRLARFWGGDTGLRHLAGSRNFAHCDTMALLGHVAVLDHRWGSSRCGPEPGGSCRTATARPAFAIIITIGLLLGHRQAGSIASDRRQRKAKPVIFLFIVSLGVDFRCYYGIHPPLHRAQHDQRFLDGDSFSYSRRGLQRRMTGLEEEAGDSKTTQGWTVVHGCHRRCPLCFRFS